MRKNFCSRNKRKPNQKELLAALLAGVIVCFTACGTTAEELSTADAQTDSTPETILQTTPQTTAQTTPQAEKQPEDMELPQPYAAYVALLKQILRERTDPDGMDYSGWEDGANFQNNCFAFADVDRDGRQELLFNFHESYMADMCEVVYDYDEETDTLRKELVTWVDTVYYSNGMVKVAASHNHGRDPYERGTWPYQLYQYDGETDSYQLLYDIDAWDGQTIPEDFPSELDTDGDELLYYIMEGGESTTGKDEVVLNQEEYDSWAEETMPEWCEIDVIYHPMTEEAIESISVGFAQAAAYAAHSDDWFIRAEYGEEIPEYLMYDMDRDGSPELITSFMQGSGRYSENCFYGLTDAGVPVKLPVVQLCGSVEKECHTVFDIGGWYRIKAYRDPNGIIYYEGHDYIREGIYGGCNESGFYYLKGGTIYQDSIRGYSEIFKNDAGNDEVHYYDRTSDGEITEKQYEEIFENYVEDMTEETVYQGWVSFTLQESTEGEIQEEIIRLKLLQSFLGSV